MIPKTVLITGSSKGLGRSLALNFAANKYNIILHGRDQPAMAEVADEVLRRDVVCDAVLGDLGSEKTIENLCEVAAKRKLDVLINNAAVDDNDPFLEITEENLDRVINTNLKAPFIMSQMAAREMIKTGGGVILHTSSINGVCGERAFSSYTATKAGLLGLNRSMAVELAEYNIRVNCVSPGYTHTDMAGNRFTKK